MGRVLAEKGYGNSEREGGIYSMTDFTRKTDRKWMNNRSREEVRCVWDASFAVCYI